MNSLSSIIWNDDAKYYDVVFADGTAAIIRNLFVLDFGGGENLSYTNTQLNVSVQNITMSATVSEEEQVQILTKLNDSAVEETLFLSSDEAEEYGLSSANFSTIYVGSTDAFSSLGAITGISETTGDYAASVRNDNAFVMTNNLVDAQSIADTVVDVVSHEAGHLTGDLTHDNGNDGLTIDDFADGELTVGNVAGTTSQVFTGSTYTLEKNTSLVYHLYDPSNTYKTVHLSGVMGDWNSVDSSSQNAQVSYNIATGSTMVISEDTTFDFAMSRGLLFNNYAGGDYHGTVDIAAKLTGGETFSFGCDGDTAVASEETLILRDAQVSSGKTLTLQANRASVLTVTSGKIYGSGTLKLGRTMISSNVDTSGFSGTVNATLTASQYAEFNSSLRNKITSLTLVTPGVMSSAGTVVTISTVPDNNVTSLKVISGPTDIRASYAWKGTAVYDGSLSNSSLSVTLENGGREDFIQLSSFVNGYTGTITIDNTGIDQSTGRAIRFILDTDMSLAAGTSSVIKNLTGASQNIKQIKLTGNATLAQNYVEANTDNKATYFTVNAGSYINGGFGAGTAAAGSTFTVLADDILGNKMEAAKVGKYILVNGTFSLGSNFTLYGGTTSLDQSFLTSGGTSSVFQIAGYGTDVTTDDIYAMLTYENSQLILTWADTSANVIAAAGSISTASAGNVKFGSSVSAAAAASEVDLNVLRGNILYIEAGSTYEGVLDGYVKVVGDDTTNIVFTVTGDILDADLSDFHGTITCKDETVTDIQVINNNSNATDYEWNENRILEGYNGSVGGYGKLVLGGTCSRTFYVDGRNGMTVSGGAASGKVNYDAKGVAYSDTNYTSYNGTMYLVNGGTVDITSISYLNNNTDFSSYTGTITVDTDAELSALYDRSQSDLATTTISVTGGTGQVRSTISNKVFGSIIYNRSGSSTDMLADTLEFSGSTIRGDLINNSYINTQPGTYYKYGNLTMTNCTVGGEIASTNNITLTNTNVSGGVSIGNESVGGRDCYIRLSGSTVGNITDYRFGYVAATARVTMTVSDNSVTGSIVIPNETNGNMFLTVGNYDSDGLAVSGTVDGDYTGTSGSGQSGSQDDIIVVDRKGTVTGSLNTGLANYGDTVAFHVGGLVSGGVTVNNISGSKIQVGGGTVAQTYGKNNTAMTGSTGATVLAGGTVTNTGSFQLYDASAGTYTTAALGTATQIASGLYGVLFYADTASNAGLSLAWGSTADAAEAAITTFRTGYSAGTYSAENSMVDGEAKDRIEFRSWLETGGGVYTVYGGTVDTIGSAVQTKTTIKSLPSGTYTWDQCAICITDSDYLNADTNLTDYHGKFVGGGTIYLASGGSINASDFMIELSGNTYFTGTVSCESGSATVNMTGNTAQSFTVTDNIVLGGTMTSGTVNVSGIYNRAVTGTGGTVSIAQPEESGTVTSGTIFNNYTGTVALASQYNVIDLTGFTGTGFTVVGGGTIKLDGALGNTFNLDNFTGTLLVDTAAELESAVSKSNSNITIIANPSAQLTDSITLTDGKAKSLTFTSGGAKNLTVSGGTYGDFSNRIGAYNVTAITGGTVTGDLNITTGTLSGAVVGGTTGIGINTGVVGGTLSLTNNTHIGNVISFKGATATNSITDGNNTCITVDATSSMGGFSGTDWFGSNSYLKLNMTVAGTVGGTVTTQNQKWTTSSTAYWNTDQVTVKQTGTIDGDVILGTGMDYLTLDVGSWISGDVNLSLNNSYAEGANHEYITISDTYGAGGGTSGHMANSTGAAGLAGRIYIPSKSGTYYQNNDYKAVTISGTTVSLNFSGATATAGTIQKVADNLYIGLFYAGNASGKYIAEDTRTSTERTNDLYGINLSIAWGRTEAEVNTAITNYRAAVTSGSISGGESAIVNGKVMTRSDFRDWLENGTQSYTVYGGTVDAVGGSVHAQSTIVSVKSGTFEADNCALRIDGTDYLAATTNIAGFTGNFVGNGTINLAAGTSIDASRFYTALESGVYFTGTVTAASGSASVNMDGNTAQSFSIDNSIELTGTMTSGTVKIGDGYERAITATGGTVEVTDGTVAGATVFASSGFGSGAAVKVDAGATLTANTTTIAAAINNAGTLTASSGTLTGAITNSGTITAAAGSIANIASNAASGTVTANDSAIGSIGSNLGTVNLNYTTVSGTIGNSSALYVTGGTLGGAVSGDGTLTVKKGTTATTVKAGIANAVVVDSGATLSASAVDFMSPIEITGTVNNSGSFIMMDGGTVNSIANSGTMSINGTAVAQVTAYSGTGTLAFDRDNIKSGSVTTHEDVMTGATIAKGTTVKVSTDESTVKDTTMGGSFTDKDGDTLWIGSCNGKTGVVAGTAGIELNSTTATASQNYHQFSSTTDIANAYTDYSGVIKVTGGNYTADQYAGNASFKINNAVTATGKYFYGGGSSNTATSNNSVTLNAALTAKGAFGGCYFTARNGESYKMNSSLTVDAAGSAVTMLAGGSNVKTSAEDETIVIEGSSTVNINAGVTAKYVFGGSVIGGTAIAIIEGDQTLNISAGNYTGAVAAGGYLQSANASMELTGNLTTNISGGSFYVIYGGVNTSKSSYGESVHVSGNVDMTFNSSENNISVRYIYAGGNGDCDWWSGNATVTFTGDGSKLNFSGSGNGVRGDNAYSETGIVGNSTLVFDDFTGTFGATYIEDFDTLSLTGGTNTNMKISCTRSDVGTDISNWNFEEGVVLDWTTGRNNLSGDTLTFGSGSVESSLDSDSSWTVWKSDSDNTFSGIESATITLFGETAGEWNSETRSCQSATYKLTLNSDHDLVVTKIA